MGRGNVTAMTDLITVNGGNMTLRIMVKAAGEGRGVGVGWGGGLNMTDLITTKGYYDRHYHCGGG